MAKPPKKPKDPAKPTRAKASRPIEPATPDALADLLNPAISKGTAGLGSGTGLQPPPDNSFDRRADFSAAHKARKSTQQGFEEAPQRDYAASPITGLDPALAKELGLGDDETALLRQKRRIPNTACRAPTCRPTPQAASAVSAACRQPAVAG